MPTKHKHNQDRPEQQPRPTPQDKLDRILAGNWEHVLDTDEYETAQERLERLQALTKWRRQGAQSGVRQLYNLAEGVSRLRHVVDTTQPDGAQLQIALLERLSAAAQGLSPRVVDLYHALVAQIARQSYAPQFEQTTTKLTELQESGDIDILCDPTIGWDIKHNRLTTRLQGYVRGAKALDRRDRRADQDIGTAFDEIEHRVLQHLFRLLAVADQHLGFGYEFAQVGGDAFDTEDAVVNNVDLAAALQFAQDRLANEVVVELGDVGLDRQALLRRRLHGRHVADAAERHVEGARDRRCREGEDIDLLAHLLQPLLVGDAKTLFFIDDHEAGVPESHVRL